MLKLYTEFNLATWARMVNLTELSIREFQFLDVKSISYHGKILKKLIIHGTKI